VLPRVAVLHHLQLAEQLDAGCRSELVPRGLDVVDEEADDDRRGGELIGGLRPGRAEDLELVAVGGRRLEELAVLATSVRPSTSSANERIAAYLSVATPIQRIPRTTMAQTSLPVIV